MPNQNDKKYLNALNKISGVGTQTLKKLIGHFESAEDAWKAPAGTLLGSGLGQKLAETVEAAKKQIDPDEEWEKLEKENISLIDWKSPNYPNLLKESARAPYIIYYKSNRPEITEIFSAPAVSIVGARKNTSYGAAAAQNLAKDLAEAGITVVSGMALGIDTWAHRGALDTNGRTIAVLGNSLEDEYIYPRDNFNLSRRIMETGAILSEYPSETLAGKLTFPARNRIVAGLTLGTVVVEAGERSGALITAQMALEDNREVFAVPGPIFSEVSRGTNQLIRSGAKTVTGVKDILEELGLEEYARKKNAPPKNPENETEKILLEILSGEPLHIDNIKRAAKLQTASAASALSLMEMKGWVKNIGGQNYILL